jgi:hypothetical protein
VLLELVRLRWGGLADLGALRLGNMRGRLVLKKGPSTHVGDELASGGTRALSLVTLRGRGPARGVHVGSGRK